MGYLVSLVKLEKLALVSIDTDPAGDFAETMARTESSRCGL
jgi:hypothetical protein